MINLNMNTNEGERFWALSYKLLKNGIPGTLVTLGDKQNY
jgi:hypothetical protein